MRFFFRHVDTVFWSVLLLMALVSLYGKVRTEMARQLPCRPVAGEVR